MPARVSSTSMSGERLPLSPLQIVRGVSRHNTFVGVAALVIVPVALLLSAGCKEPVSAVYSAFTPRPHAPPPSPTPEPTPFSASTVSPRAGAQPSAQEPSPEPPPCFEQLHGARLETARLLTQAAHRNESLDSILRRATSSIRDLETVLRELRDWPCVEHGGEPLYPYRMRAALLLFAMAPGSEAATDSLFDAVTRPSPYGSHGRVWLNEDGPCILAEAYRLTRQPRVLQRLLELGTGDGALGEAAEGVYYDLIAENPREFLAALAGLPVVSQVHTLAEAISSDGLSRGSEFNQRLRAAIEEPAHSLEDPLHFQAELALHLVQEAERASEQAERRSGGT